jgi:RNA-directed DNA polymerase
MDKNVLKQWLKAGYIEKDAFQETENGCPQGGPRSATLANIALDWLETIILELAKQGKKINFVKYADDFICTVDTKEILETKVQPAIINFLKERDLELSLEKTKITHMNDGFDFLGFNIRKYRDKLLKTKCFIGQEILRKNSRNNPAVGKHPNSKTHSESELKNLRMGKLLPQLRGKRNLF